MKTFLRRLAAVFLCVSLLNASAVTPSGPPTLLASKLSGKYLLVTASIPKGWGASVLETRTSANTGAWVPRAIMRSTGKVVFRISSSYANQPMRVRGILKEALPRSLYGAQTVLAKRKSTLWRPDQGRGEVFMLAADGSVPSPATPSVLSRPIIETVSAGGVSSAISAVSVSPVVQATAGPANPNQSIIDVTTTAPAATAAPAREVEESDIWKQSGNTLYFFNQLRGLQVIDVSNPDSPRVSGTLSLPDLGEEMYLLDAQHVVLLTQDYCSGNGQSQAVVVDVSSATPKVLATVPIQGNIQESRLVGTALYVASQYYQSSSTGASGQPGTLVASFDLSVPSSPAARSALWYPGTANAVMATDDWLFVAVTDYSGSGNSKIRAIDCTAADGTLRDVASIAIAGRVEDKFKMSVSGNILRVISQSPNYVLVSVPTDWGTVQLSEPASTALETFTLGPAASRVGYLQIVQGEGLYATRFDGDRAYVVTFQQVDPLWIVDLSDPAQPAIMGKVSVPGYSSYIEPLGDRLVTVGSVSHVVTVSLFDVHDPTQPSLLSSVPLGQNYSWSEANQNEKALTVLPDLGLILVPYEGTTTTNGYADRVQLIDLATNSLTARGVIEHKFAPRRTSVVQGRVLSISSEELLSTDISDRDQPVVRADLPLGWPVNNLFLSGSYLLEITSGNSWFGGTVPAVQVAPAGLPNVAVNQLTLTNLPIVGSSVHEGKLYLLQCPPAPYYWGAIPVVLGSMQTVQSPTNLVMSVIDVSALPTLTLLGQVTVPANSATAFDSSYQALWPQTNVVVWFSTGFNFWINPLLLMVAPAVESAVSTAAAPGVIAGNPAGFDVTTVAANVPTGRTVKQTTLYAKAATLNAQSLLAMPYYWPWWNNGGVRLLAFDVSTPAEPLFESRYEHEPENSWGFGTPYAAQGLIYFTHEQTYPIAIPASQGGLDYRLSEVLDVIDFSDPANPTARPGLNVPGQLSGISADGSVLYLWGDVTSGSGLTFQDHAAVSACAYDGVAAHRFAILLLPSVWPEPLLVSGDNIFLGRSGANRRTASTLETWALSPQGRFVRRALLKVPEPAVALAATGGLLLAQDQTGDINLFDVTTPTALRAVGQGIPGNCLSLDPARAVGGVDQGLWFPLDAYGAQFVPVNP